MAFPDALTKRCVVSAFALPTTFEPPSANPKGDFCKRADDNWSAGFQPAFSGEIAPHAGKMPALQWLSQRSPLGLAKTGFDLWVVPKSVSRFTLNFSHSFSTALSAKP
jgi:hypothetical protein